MAQVPGPTSAMRVDPALQRERDTTRMSILRDELAKESRELANSENDLHSFQTSQTSSDKFQGATARVTLHRQNLISLEREIALVKSPVNPATTSREVKEVSTSPQGRQPDNWLIFRPQVPAVDQNVVPNMWLRRQLPLATLDEALIKAAKKAKVKLV